MSFVVNSSRMYRVHHIILMWHVWDMM